ncbi:cordon-bleu protein-like 1b [Erpetoichthys calabaricus]|uniref:Cordon-bleu WH2 repeat protein like 1 n=1 Tax=Erpetoichthys calabaricus TaxID=27687 RepID=A0A8C4SH05_ERPCA|nr:cordon-bleu protein-like 1b [Erpetoichthys calabaricus]XP_028662214.1 cordon-bleu protein-like 1b [Erpetoichthys calabaricus]XP_028662215.1 cordon-bleu protein-like 1b [Erpetoichthys calabaricus]XP_028662216.1 cordon-bleu protein-like 1b [Erpetoichthys calabaricus]
MEQKENLIDKDIELIVVLPGGKEKITTVHGSKPVMDVLIFLCGMYHLNPSSHTIELISTNRNQIKFKPNSLIGTLEAEKILLKPKATEEKNKKALPVVPEVTVRLVINYKKTQKTVLRVSPEVALQSLIPAISEKCEFDSKNTVLLKNFQSKEVLDLTKSLNDLGLRELYALDSRGISTDVQIVQDAVQTSQDSILKEKEKGFFSMFRRSKKRQDQVASAPASPAIQQRPGSMNSLSANVSTFCSNTLPSERPKKRQAPLPPMAASQSMPKDLSSMQAEPESKQELPQLSRAASSESSLKRTKRKAPLPPSCKSAQDLPLENGGNDTGTQFKLSPSERNEHTNALDCHDESTTVNIPSEAPCLCTSAESKSTSGKAALPQNADVQSLPAVSQSFEKENVDGMTTDNKNVANGEVNKQVMETFGHSNAVTFQPKGNDNLKGDRKVMYKNEETCTENEEIIFATELENKSVNKYVKTSVALQSKPDEQVTLDQDAKPTVFKKKMQDAAIQASVDISVEEVNKYVELNGCSTASPLLEQSVMKHHLINSSENEQRLPCSNVSPCKQEGPVREIATSTEKMVIECVLAQSSENDEFQNIATSPPVYKRDLESKPKPSNEVTRDYIPKIGMTTYKIVPQKSLEKLRFFEVELTLESPSKTPEEEETSTVPVQAMRYESDPQKYLETPLGPTVNVSQIMKHSEVSETTENVVYATTQPAQVCSTEKEEAGFDSQLSSPSELDDHPSSPLDINQKKVPPAVKPKPGSFRLSLQKKPPGYYVTSAASKSLNNCTVSAANEKDAGDEKTDEIIAETECGSPPLPTLLPAVPEVSTIYQSPPDLNRSDQPVSKCSRPLSYPYKDASVPSFQKLRSFTVSKASTRTSPSPFALAVSSAVKRSQSLNKGSNFNSQSFQKLSNASLAQSSTTKELKEHSKDFNQSISSTRTFEQVPFSSDIIAANGDSAASSSQT